MSKSEFVRKARLKHGRKYDYSLVEYVLSKTKVTIHCRMCNTSFLQSPNSHLAGYGCPPCGVKKQVESMSRHHASNVDENTQIFIRKASSVHGTDYSYEDSVITHLSGRVRIKCNNCDRKFVQMVGNHLGGKGCLPCSYVRRGAERGRTLEEFLLKARKVHSNFYDYSLVKDVNWKRKIDILCPNHQGVFSSSVGNHLAGYGCPICSRSRRYSRMGIRWLETIAKSQRIKIQHAENGGEFLVPGTSFKADGFNARSNTIYEFYGDSFHGNPKVHSPDSKPNCYSKLTAKELYAATKAREKSLRRLGYTVVTMWESDWKVIRDQARSL